MSIKPKWLRDLASLIFTGYYVVFANAADEKVLSKVNSDGRRMGKRLPRHSEQLRKFRALGSVEFLRATWDKSGNPYVRALTRSHRPRVPLRRKILIPRPNGSPYK
jgi:hypothetical protein